MKKTDKKIFLFLLAAAAAAFFFAGIKWGLPSDAKNALYFSSRESLAENIRKAKLFSSEDVFKTLGGYARIYAGVEEKKLEVLRTALMLVMARGGP